MLFYCNASRLLASKCLKPTISINCCRTSFKRSDTPTPDDEIIKNINKKQQGMERETFEGEFDMNFPPKGRIYDKVPFKMELKEGKKYSWCTCGFSKSQPLCDGTHKKLSTTSFFKKNVFVPIRFTVEETKDYFLCNCKQTSNRPFCDGTHRREDIKEKRVPMR